jgi:predicted small integral membrane protein
MRLGAFNMISRYRASAAEFKNAKKFTSLGLSLGVLLWFSVFIAMGGEWFLMWQSKNWNAQPTAFFLTCCFLLFLIHHNQEDI